MAAVVPAANDGDPDGDTLVLIGYKQGSHGTVSCSLGSLCTYTPRRDFNGIDQWEYTVSDGTGRTAVAHVLVNVRLIDDPPRPAADRLSFVRV